MDRSFSIQKNMNTLSIFDGVDMKLSPNLVLMVFSLEDDVSCVTASDQVIL